MGGQDKTVLVVGCGIAGLCATLECARRGLKVILVAPNHSERAQSVMAAGGINAVLPEGDPTDSTHAHALDTLKGGCFLESLQTLEAFCARAPETVRWLEELGVVFSRNADGSLAQRAFGGQSHRRTVYAGSSTGKQVVTALVSACRQEEARGNVVFRSGMHFHSALVAAGLCHGALLFAEGPRCLEPVYADFTIMATGGANRLFGKTTGSLLCDGYATGRLLEQGVTLRNLEFIQYHPTTVETSHKRMLVTEAARGEGGRLYYLEGGERVYFMEERYGPRGNLMPRDIVARAIHEAPSQVYLDISFLGSRLIDERLGEVYELCRDYLDLDVCRQSIPVAPSVHFFMGGIDVDDDHQTSVERLYAVGECASKYHGANRLGGNSLLACATSGRIAAAHCASRPALPDAAADLERRFEGFVAEQRQQLERLKASRSTFPALYLEQQLAEAMNAAMGISRSRECLEEGLASLEFLADAAHKINFDAGVSLYENFRLGPMVLLAQASVMSALAREETRGAHIRSDFPETRTEYARSSLVSCTQGKLELSWRTENEEADKDHARDY